MLRPRQYNFLAALEQSLKSQPAYVDRSTLLEFCEAHKGQKGPYGYILRWPSWLTYNQTSGSPYKTLRRGVFRLPWAEYNSWREAQKVAPATSEDRTSNGDGSEGIATESNLSPNG